MRKISLFLMSLFLTVGAIAQTITGEPVDYSIVTGNGATGTLSRTDDNTTSTWKDVFTFATSVSNPAALKLQVTREANPTYQFDMQALNGGLTIATGGDTYPTLYTLTVPAPWKIVSYSFDVKSTNNNTNTITPCGGEGQVLTTSNTNQTFSVTNINSRSAAFELLGTNTSHTVTNFVVKVALDFDNGIYTFETSRGFLVYSEESDYVASTKGYTVEDDSKNWCVYKSEETGKYYFYNLVANKFLGAYNSNSRFEWVDVPNTDVKIVASTKNGYPFIFSTDGKTGAINHHNHTQTAPHVTNWSSGLSNLADDGSSHRLVYVSDADEALLADIANSVAAFEADNTAAVAELNAAITKAQTLFGQVTIGTGVGEYTATDAEYMTKFNAIIAFRDAIQATNNPKPAEVEAKVAEVNALIASFQLNMPVAGKYYRFYCAAGQRYLASDISNDRLEMQTTNENIEDQIFLCTQNGDDLAIVSYSKGQAINAYNLDNIATMSAAVFSATYNNVYSQYNIKVGNRYIYGQGNTQNNHIDSGAGNPNSNGYNWIIEEVTTLPVTITTAKYATFYAPVAVTVPAGVTAHTVTINGEWATLSEALEVIPANTGVVLYSETAGTYNFAITDDVEAIEGNALRGSAAATYYTTAGTYYALGLVEGEVGFYKDDFKNSRFQNNSHKAYLYIKENIEESSVAKSIAIRFPGTTGVEEVEIRNEKEEIYDLTGRRVNEITKSGVYIINGKKILVK